jgi:hypothetical protein
MRRNQRRHRERSAAIQSHRRSPMTPWIATSPKARRKTGVLPDALRLLAMTIPSKRVVL